MSYPDPAQHVMQGRLLAGRTAVISGAGRATGMGRAIAELFLQHGACVALLDLNEAEVQATASGLAHHGSPVIGIACDVSRQQDCQAAIAQVAAWQPAGGRIDVLVHSAGITQKAGILEITESDFHRVTDINLKGVLQLSQCVLPFMQAQGKGSLIAISSLSAQQGGGVFGGGHYCASKAGVLGLSRSIAKEFGPQGIRANAVTPGLIVTDFARTGSTAETLHAKAAAAGWPLNRAGYAAEIAGACLFLASDLSAYVTGATLDVNGGAYMH